MVWTASLDGEPTVGAKIVGVSEPPQAAMASAKTIATAIGIKPDMVFTLNREAVTLKPILLYFVSAESA